MTNRPSHVRPRPPDVIVVPTVRPGKRLRHATGLAEALGCPLVALRSRQPPRSEPLVAGVGVPVFVLDIAPGATHGLPAFETDALLRRTPFHVRTDLSLKRNLAFRLARQAGWSRVFFLDDDVTVPDVHDVRRAVGLLDRYAAAGLVIDGFPDGAVASHATFALGASAGRSVAGGALAVTVADPPSFFPTIYNEDLCYLLHEGGMRPSAVTGRALQEPYDPFRDPGRAGVEEFGETVVGGLHYIASHGYAPRDADAEYWRVFLNKRDRRLAEVRDQAASTMDGALKEAVYAALSRAREMQALITPALCVAYVAAWLRDRDTWGRYLRTLRETTLEGALRHVDQVAC
ncbi:hypothetical protein I0C86_30745 [Plantactinospora sp. S1510]|uniref:Glycosyltransferase 2-like domain-containing protein n=1 Tax=Plantactinospora alkalitolerans TaxID=2789879 RepID=A0ABS0H4C7_9ACTN|nr:hypothetical protein [Plantactinospora alkalitolerans]MBF9133310.1 hypothetical protein [Plantactinospora alkalitolerans]